MQKWKGPYNRATVGLLHDKDSAEREKDMVDYSFSTLSMSYKVYGFPYFSAFLVKTHGKLFEHKWNAPKEQNLIPPLYGK